ncbi:sensor histidine kinase [Flavilitoribacter nigricans]|uniref:Histidine kinase domain-containing protein n=1 Tax=Flavilitoribacter nigricans (strain ATCC 23147 / DSM 23189 / NBRC 102662 / NCIMB 1420 / SS-2) TaxID=1122177 RepID=A0A2D0N2V5_FLAN2|nr:histidine kinase [Flavilitoribacter nigricans]PHN02073.1 hypothetical protein CRP01_34130 [Flavilitoribacter nigricans DSM 23189 = NBRC 102662]
MNWKKYAPIPYWQGILVALLLACLFTLKSYLRLKYFNELEYFKLGRTLGVHTVNYLLWALLLPLLNYFFERFPIHDSPWRTKGIALALSLTICFFHEFTSSLMLAIPANWLGYYPLGDDNMAYIIRGLRIAVPDRFLEYWIIYAILTAMRMQRKFRNKELELVKVENQLSSARLNALRLQLQPHFLFNTLNTISSLMEINVNAAQKVVSRLGGLLRFVLDKDERNFIPLREELEFVRNYLDIEQTRFNDRLSVQYDIDDATQEIWVPHLILQPLVENAIKHGFSNRSNDGKIEVITRKLDDKVEMVIRDDGCGTDLSPEELLRAGIGLSNVKKRLELLYGETAEMEITTRPEEGFSVCILLPIKRPEA